MLHVVFNKESSNFVTGVMVIEDYQTSDEKEECEHWKTKTHQNGLEKLEFNTKHTHTPSIYLAQV